MSLTSIVDWTPFELLIYASRILMILLAAGMLGSLINILRKMNFSLISKAGKIILVMLVIYLVNIELFYLGFAISRPTVSLGSLRNIGDIVFLSLGILMCRYATQEALDRQKKPLESYEED